jgi:hypothetical protein
LRSGRHDGKGGLSARSVAYTHRIVTHALKDAVSWGRLLMALVRLTRGFATTPADRHAGGGAGPAGS